MVLMPAVPIIAAVATIGSAIDQRNRAERAEKEYKNSLLSRGEAEQRANDSLSSVYDKHLNDTLAALDKGAASRGFYGQAPADAYKRSTAAQIEGDRGSAIAKLATDMQGQTAAQAAQQAQLAVQSAQQQSNQRYQQAMATGYYPTGTGIWGTIGTIANNWGNLFGGQKPQATSGGIGGNIVMSPDGKVGYQNGNFGLGNLNAGNMFGSNPYYHSDFNTNMNSGIDFSGILKGGSWKSNNPLDKIYSW
jgi:hypothetical protein